MLLLSSKITSLLLIAVILVGSLLCPCVETLAAEPTGSQLQNFEASNGVDSHHCPDCPERHPEQSDSCASCGCLCHFPVTMQLLTITHAPLITEMVFLEPFTVLPEVYLPKFVPPQIQA